MHKVRPGYDENEKLNQRCGFEAATTQSIPAFLNLPRRGYTIGMKLSDIDVQRLSYGPTSWRRAIECSLNGRALGFLAAPHLVGEKSQEILDGALVTDPIMTATPAGLITGPFLKPTNEFYGWPTIDPWTRDFAESLEWFPDEPPTPLAAIAHVMRDGL